MQRNTTCECAACSNIPQLDLKMVVHFGDYVETSLAGRQELSGPDVILVHRLLKNAIVEDTGIAAYAAYTEAAVATIGMDEVFAQAVAHHENTEEFGDVVLRVMDLTPGWQAHREASRIRVADDAPRWFEDISIDLAVPPDRVWFHLIHPEQRSKWGLGVIGLDREGTDRGRVVPGTTDHCAHGDGSTLIYTIVDVAPFESYSIEVALPMGGRIRTSLFLDAVDGGTRVNLRCAKPEAGSALVTGLLGLMVRSQAKTVREAWFSGLTKLQELCRQEVADGVLTAVDATAFDAEAISGVARGLASAEG
ncbi:MAG: DUF2652 domain-containing protein, partial [Alphaproteobacteria bacterium]|nr:DUF2652 domain-containing protein [Alphaproteobacteria bacterium]